MTGALAVGEIREGARDLIFKNVIKTGSEQEIWDATIYTSIIDGILMIREAKSPTLVREMLLAYLPEKHRHMEEDEAEGAVAAA